jgi:hypothetical protein
MPANNAPVIEASTTANARSKRSPIAAIGVGFAAGDFGLSARFLGTLELLTNHIF